MGQDDLQETRDHPDFFISYVKSDEDWAEWIATQLEQDGYAVTIEAWDFRPGDHLIEKKNQALQRAERTLLVLSPGYLQSNFTYFEWAAVLSDDIRDNKELRLLPVFVEACQVTGFLGAIIPIDLVGLEKGQEARTRLLKGIRRKRAQPTDSIAFLGSSSTSPSAAPPGTLPAAWNNPFANNLYVTNREEHRATWRREHLLLTLQRYQKHYGPSFDPATTFDARIQLEYVDRANPSDNENSIFEIYQKNEDLLLLLGRTGSGKSTSMKELTLKLMERELNRGAYTNNIRFPIFLPLIEWRGNKKPIKAWLTEYLMNEKHAHFGLDRQLIQNWIREDRFILLLDGLDDMSEEDSRKCLQEIEKWQQETKFSTLIISCQIDRYEALKDDKHFFKAGVTSVILRNLNDAQGQSYLAQIKQTELSRFLYQTEEGQHLKRFVETPLLLNLLAQTISGKDLKQQISEIKTEDDVFKKYINRYIDESKLYNGYNARFWLIRMAYYMGDGSTFSLQPGHLSGNKIANRFYTGGLCLVFLLLGGGACIFVICSGFPLWQLLPLFAMFAGFYGYLWKSLLTGFYMLLLYTFTLLYPSFSLEATRGRTRWQKIAEMAIALAVLFSPLLLLGILVFLLEWLTDVPFWLVLVIAWLLGGLFWYLFSQLRKFSPFQRLTERSLVLETWLALRDLMVFRQVDDPLPLENFSSRLSLKLITGMLLGIAAGILVWLTGRYFWQTNLLALALLVGLSVWLDRGLGTNIRSFVLRFCFWRAKLLPWATAFFRDVVSGHLLVKQRDGIYKFQHSDIKRHLAKKMPHQKG